MALNHDTIHVNIKTQTTSSKISYQTISLMVSIQANYTDVSQTCTCMACTSYKESHLHMKSLFETSNMRYAKDSLYGTRPGGANI